VRLILASRSPRRRELLARIGLPFEVRTVEVDETPHRGEDAADYVVRLAVAKARAAYDGVEAGAAVVLGADTAVVLGDEILGKPTGREDGVRMLLALSGRIHRVTTGIAVHGQRGTVSRCVASDVRFRVIEPWEAEAYWGTGEGADKAGSYGIQGIGGIFAESIRGSYSAVVGLPLAETELLLRDYGLDTWRERT